MNKNQNTEIHAQQIYIQNKFHVLKSPPKMKVEDKEGYKKIFDISSLDNESEVTAEIKKFNFLNNVKKEKKDYEEEAIDARIKLSSKCTTRHTSRKHFKEAVEFIERMPSTSRVYRDKETFLNNLISIMPKEIMREEMMNFLFSPLPQDRTFICKIKKQQGKGIDKMYPKYYMYLGNNDKLIMVAKKIPNSTSSTYNIMLNDSQFEEGSVDYIGKVSSNFICSEFYIFGKGANPKKKTTNKDEYRIQYGCVSYVNEFLILRK
jgi:hypothetical protein